ncbi:hypothetical protein ACIO1C_03765 [Streptomyces sp. NPDC087420]|uniref:hypothetical protein n=1 Tax=Streptomyces sp. NPDC087420 TaxID=3365785 RepID=UPI003838CC94
MVARLAADEVPGVRRVLCAHAPHELMVEAYATAQDRNWPVLRHHPHFPRPGLAQFADDPHPRLRHAASDDPEAGPELPSRPADDPDVGDWSVRDPRLLAAETVAAVHRAGQRASAFAAVASPALPPELTRRPVDLVRG